jgi:hypothetical protein
VLRLTWVRDELAHELKHADIDEPTGTWTGSACPDHRLATGTGVDTSVLAPVSKPGEIADLIREAPEDLAAGNEQAHHAAMLACQAGDLGLAGKHWRNAAAIWSSAWAANCAAPDFMQETGLTWFAPVKPQRRVGASFEHHCDPHGAQKPHVHDLVITALTTGAGGFVTGTRQPSRLSRASTSLRLRRVAG